MGQMIELTSSDGHRFGAYQAEPEGVAKGGVVILQEIFGVTDHIRSVADLYAGHGYLAIAPSLFDRVSPGIVLDYSQVEEARGVMTGLDLDNVVADMAAAADVVRSAGKVAAIGYCWGGAMADLAACRIGVNAAVAYYGRMIVEWLDEAPKCPALYHFGARDPLIPPDVAAEICSARSDHQSFIYENAGHGFSCDERSDFEPESAALALQRTLDFLDENLAAD
jgi:carboxymethylenebutenolidase